MRGFRARMLRTFAASSLRPAATSTSSSVIGSALGGGSTRPARNPLAPLRDPPGTAAPRACGTWRNRSASGDVVIAEAVGAPAKAIPREIVQVNWSGKAVVPLGVTDRWAWMISPGTYEDLSNDMPRNTPIAWRIDALADVLFAPSRAVTWNV